MNWISPTGLSPCAAMPTHSPLIRSSASGVSITRSGPKRCCSPAVARNTPPLTPTSSPSTTTFGSSAMARASARLMASTRLTSGIGRAFELVALSDIHLRKLGIEMIEHALRRPRRAGEIALDRRVDALLAFGDELFLLRLVPCLLSHEIGSQPRDRLLLPTRLDVLGRTIAACVIGGSMVTEPIGERLDQAWTFAGAGMRDRLVGRRAHSDDIVSVHLLAGKARGNRLLGKRVGCRLQLEGHGNGPLIIVGDEHERQLPHARNVHRPP